MKTYRFVTTKGSVTIPFDTLNLALQAEGAAE